MAKIINEFQYKWAVARVEALLPIVTEEMPETAPERIELELLSDLVADYSEVHFSLGEPSLNEVLKLKMYELGLTQKALAEIIGVSPSRLCEIGRAHV